MRNDTGTNRTTAGSDVERANSPPDTDEIDSAQPPPPELGERVLVPIACEEDARTTCAAMKTYLQGTERLRVVHVIEKGGGAPDKAPLAARQQQATTIFDLVTALLGGTDFDLETECRYGTDVVDEIVAAADASNATTIAFVPRTHGRITRLLTGDRTQRLVTMGRVPILVLPQPSP